MPSPESCQSAHQEQTIPRSKNAFEGGFQIGRVHSVHEMFEQRKTKLTQICIQTDESHFLAPFQSGPCVCRNGLFSVFPWEESHTLRILATTVPIFPTLTMLRFFAPPGQAWRRGEIWDQPSPRVNSFAAAGESAVAARQHLQPACSFSAPQRAHHHPRRPRRPCLSRNSSNSSSDSSSCGSSKPKPTTGLLLLLLRRRLRLYDASEGRRRRLVGAQTLRPPREPLATPGTSSALGLALPPARR